MKVKALKNYYSGARKVNSLLLKKDKIYVVIEIETCDGSFWVIDEEGDEWIYSKELFEIIG